MKIRIFCLLLLNYFATSHIFAAQCNAIFPDAVQTNNNGGQISFNNQARVVNSPDNILDTKSLNDNSGGNSCTTQSCSKSNKIAASVNYNNFGNGNSSINLDRRSGNISPGFFNSITLNNSATLRISPGDYYVKSSLSVNNFSQIIIEGSGVVRFFIKKNLTLGNGSTVNLGGNANQLLMHVNSSVNLQYLTKISAFIYSKQNISMGSDSQVVGSLNGKNVYLGYQARVTFPNENPDFGDYCEGDEIIPISCTANLPALAFSDDFSQSVPGWSSENFSTNESNWPGDNIYYSSSEEHRVVWALANSKLSINGSVTSNGDNEYGMVKYDPETSSIDKTSTTNYVLAADITANKNNTNNDVGLIFGFIDDENYYLARWNKYGTSYSNDNNFPGVYRRLELIEMSGGTATRLDHLDNFNVNDPFNLSVVANEQGIAVCVNDDALLYSDVNPPNLNDVGVFTYDNDVGVQIDDLEIRCNDCQIAGVAANYQFDECQYTGNGTEVIDQIGDYSGTSHNSVNTTDSAKIERALNLTSARHHVEVAIPLPSSFSVSTWFKKPTASDGSRYFVLGAMANGGDLMYLDRGRNWRWHVYVPSRGNIAGTYSFASLDNNWHHLTTVYTNNRTDLYIDGQWVDSIKLAPSGTLKYIGTSFDSVNTNSAQGFRAPLDEFIVFSSALSATDISDIYRNQNNGANYDGTIREAVNCDNSVAFFQFEQSDFSSGIDDTNELFSGNNIGGLSTSAGKYCRGFDPNGTNTSVSTNHAFSSNVDLDRDVGAQGTISFWYNANTHWNQGGYGGDGERTLFDASVGDKYFVLEISDSGLLHFTFEDSVDRDFGLTEPNTATRQANQWYYITTTWNYSSKNFALYVDGNLVRSSYISNVNGQVANLGPIIFGDNAVSYSSNNHVSLASQTSANGRFDEVRIYNSVLTVDEIRADMNENTCSASIDHFEIVHDGNGLTCQAESITIKACADESCNTLNPDLVDVDLIINDQFNQRVTVTGGATSAAFNYTESGIAKLSLDQKYECNNNGSSSCDVNFTNTGFVFYANQSRAAINDQLSGKPSNVGFNNSALYIQAIETNSDTGACQAALVDAVDIELYATCENPTACAGSQVVIDNLSTAKSINTLSTNATPSYSNVEFNFGNNSENAAPFIFTYADAGQMQLHARYNIPLEDGTPSNDYMVGSSDTFIVRPFGFYLDIPENPRALSATDEVFKSAGELFPVTLTAKAWESADDANNDGKPDTNAALGNNSITANFGQEIIAESAVIEHALVLPSGGVEGTLDSKNFSGFANGMSSQSISWSEVGIVSLSVNLSDNQYLTSEDITAYEANVGRFTPDHFKLDIVDNGDMASVCGATINGYTYVGQMTDVTSSIGALQYQQVPEFTITAKSAVCDSFGECSSTLNYTGDFLKLLPSNVEVHSVTQDGTAIGADKTPVTISSSISEGTWEESNGVITHQFNVLDHYVYDHVTNAQIKPFPADINIGIKAIVDSDRVKAIDTDVTDDIAFPNNIITLEPDGGEIRFARWLIENGYGPETDTLTLSMKIQQFNGTDFVVNTDESCITPLINNKLETGTVGGPGLSYWDYRLVDIESSDNIDPEDTDASISGSFNLGEIRKLIFSAPNQQGALEFEYKVPTWLRYDWNNNGSLTNDPSSTITFGRFRGNDRIISWREVVN